MVSGASQYLNLWEVPFNSLAVAIASPKAPNIALPMTERLGAFPIKTRHLPSFLLRRSLLIYLGSVGKLGRRLATMSRLYPQSGSNSLMLDPDITAVQEGAGEE